MLTPKTKYRFSHRLSYEGSTKGNKKLHWGNYGLQALEGAWITTNQIEAARKVISKYTKKSGKMIINLQANLPKSKKPLEVRMGGGKSGIDRWVAVVKKGLIIFEVKGLTNEIATKALLGATHKLPIKCKVVSYEPS